MHRSRIGEKTTTHATMIPMRWLLLVLLLVCSAPAAAATGEEEAAVLVSADRWGPISTPMPAAAVEKFEAAVVGYASLRGEVVAPLEEVRFHFHFYVYTTAPIQPDQPTLTPQTPGPRPGALLPSRARLPRLHPPPFHRRHQGPPPRPALLRRRPQPNPGRRGQPYRPRNRILGGIPGVARRGRNAGLCHRRPRVGRGAGREPPRFAGGAVGARCVYHSWGYSESAGVARVSGGWGWAHKRGCDTF